MGEKDRMRGFGSPSICSEVRTPSPQPSPLRGEGVPCASFAVFSSPNAPVLAAHLGARVFSARDRERIARQQKTVMSNAKPVRVKESQGWGLPFGLRYAGFVEDIEGSGTPANAGHQPPHLAMRRAPIRSAHACRRSTAALTSGSISSQRLGFRA